MAAFRNCVWRTELTCLTSLPALGKYFFHDRRDYVVFVYAVGKTLITKLFCLGDMEFICNKAAFIFTDCSCGCVLGCVKNQPLVFLGRGCFPVS